MKKRQASGYSLIEVLIAIAITSVVLLTVITLFYMGRRNVYSGKQQTIAAASGTQILEDFSTMTAQDLGTNFSITDGKRFRPSADSSVTCIALLPSIPGISSWCGRRDLNPHALRHENLNLACLPIPPRPPAERDDSKRGAS